MNASDRNQTILWARKVLANPTDYYILDTETTGLNDPEVIELAVIDLEEEMIINQRFRPKTEIETGATAIHGITSKMLSSCPEWSLVADRFEKIVSDRQLLIYNFNFDAEAISHTYSVHNLLSPILTGSCIMYCYSQFVGDWNEYWNSYTWQKLPGGNHSAIGDCRATLAVIKGMAESPIQTD